MRLRAGLRPLVVAALAAVLVGGTGAVVPAGAGAPGGTCHLVLPARIVVDDIVSTPPARAAGSCTTSLAESQWSTTRGYDAYGDQAGAEPAGYAAYDRGPREIGPGHYGTDADVELFGGTLPWGRTTFYPVYAGRGCTQGVCRTTYTQNDAVTDVRLATRSGLTATRRAGRVTLHGTASVFSTDSLRYRPHVVRARFESRSAGAAWATVREVTTSAGGRTRTVVAAPRGRQYRFVTATAAHWWSSSSRVVVR